MKSSRVVLWAYFDFTQWTYKWQLADVLSETIVRLWTKRLELEFTILSQLADE